jgi:hypothetical protein
MIPKSQGESIPSLKRTARGGGEVASINVPFWYARPLNVSTP